MTNEAGKTESEHLPEVVDLKKGLSLLGGIAPKDFGELTRFAELVQRSKLAPSGFDTVEKVAVGMLTNMELGRPIITGLQDLAIINGRCSIYGDASYAMVTASNLMAEGYPKSSETGTPYTDDWTFTFIVKRIGRPEEAGVWTWIDSKRAGFDDPKLRSGGKDVYSPWRRFTRRMMQWKARNFVLRDNFGDVLKGMKTVEDLHDLDAVPLTKGAGGTYSAEPSTTSDLTDAIKKKADGQNDVEEKDKKDIPVPCPYCQANIKTVIITMMESGAETFTCPACKKDGKIEGGLPVGIPPVGQNESDGEPDFRNEWIRLKGPGFSTYFHKHRDAFEKAAPELQAEAKAKWKNFYDVPWPLDKEVDPCDALLDELNLIGSNISNAASKELGFDNLGRPWNEAELKELLEKCKELDGLSPEGAELNAVNTEINNYPTGTVDQAKETLELPTNRALSLNESNSLLDECRRLTKPAGEDLA